MAEENIQGPNGPHIVDINPLEHAEGELQEPADLGIFSAPGTVPALEDEPVE